MNLKKKLGPLPVWAWAAIGAGVLLIIYIRGRSSSSSSNANQVDPSNPMGLTYGQESQDLAQGIDPNTGQSFAAEQSAAALGGGGVSGGGGSGDSGAGAAPDDSGELGVIDSDLQTISTELTNGSGLTDPGATDPGQAVAGEISDIQAAASALEAAGLVGAPTPPGAAAPGAGNTITTHPGGPFYNFYKSVTGKPPPPTVQSSSLIYSLWKAGKTVTQAKAATGRSSGSGAAGSSGAKSTTRTTTNHTAPKQPKSGGAGKAVAGGTRTLVRGNKRGHN